MFGFWKGALITGPGGKSLEAMGSFALNRSGEKALRPLKHRPAAARHVPSDLRAALTDHAEARTTFASFSPSARGEYIEWLSEAKRPETRARRLATTLEWLTAGKQRHWKYQNGR